MNMVPARGIVLMVHDANLLDWNIDKTIHSSVNINNKRVTLFIYSRTRHIRLLIRDWAMVGRDQRSKTKPFASSDKSI